MHLYVVVYISQVKIRVEKSGHSSEDRTKDLKIARVRFWPAFERYPRLTQGTARAQSRRPRNGRGRGAR